jgi:hypothetical protein
MSIDIEGVKIDCSSLFIVPATSAAQNRLLFFFFLLRPFTVLMKKTRAIKQSIIFRCLWECHTAKGKQTYGKLTMRFQSSPIGEKYPIWTPWLLAVYIAIN